MNKVFCWNHTITAAKQWLHKHNMPATDISMCRSHPVVATFAYDAAYTAAYVESSVLWILQCRNSRACQHVTWPCRSQTPGSVRYEVRHETEYVRRIHTVVHRMHEFSEAPFDVSILISYRLTTTTASKWASVTVAITIFCKTHSAILSLQVLTVTINTYAVNWRTIYGRIRKGRIN